MDVQYQITICGKLFCYQSNLVLDFETGMIGWKYVEEEGWREKRLFLNAAGRVSTVRHFSYFRHVLIHPPIFSFLSHFGADIIRMKY